MLYLLVSVDVDGAAVDKPEQQVPRLAADPVDVHVVSAGRGSSHVRRDARTRGRQDACVGVEDSPVHPNDRRVAQCPCLPHRVQRVTHRHLPQGRRHHLSPCVAATVVAMVSSNGK